MQHIDSLKKENFNIKLKVHFLEERLAQLAPDQIDEALKQNINLKIEVQQRGMKIKKLKKLVLEAQRELERLQRGSGSSESRVQYLEEKLAERDRELSELRRRRVGEADERVVRELEARNAELEDRNMELEEQLEGVRTLLEDNAEEMERLKEIVESGEDARSGDDGGRMRKQVDELEIENEELRRRLDEQEDLATRNDEEKEELADQVEMLKLKLEDFERRREAENLERSQSRAQILEEREEREAVEEDLNAVRDKLAAAQIELQQKDDEVDLKNREIDEIVAEHERIVRQVEDEWRGEVDEARGRVDELKDVCMPILVIKFHFNCDVTRNWSDGKPNPRSSVSSSQNLKRACLTYMTNSKSLWPTRIEKQRRRTPRLQPLIKRFKHLAIRCTDWKRRTNNSRRSATALARRMAWNLTGSRLWRLL